MYKNTYYIINSITLYRLVAAPVLLFFSLFNLIGIFKWLLIISFLSDLIDGFLARKFKSASPLGAELDSLADDLTIAVAVISLFLYYPEFIHEQLLLIFGLFLLYCIQTIFALVRYGKLSCFHTYAAKLSAVLQAFFLISAFFYKPVSIIFYVTVLITSIDLIEEVILLILLPKWTINVKGLYWLYKKTEHSS